MLIDEPLPRCILSDLLGRASWPLALRNGAGAVRILGLCDRGGAFICLGLPDVLAMSAFSPKVAGPRPPSGGAPPSWEIAGGW
jgi:hypothetical protein